MTTINISNNVNRVVIRTGRALRPKPPGPPEPPFPPFPPEPPVPPQPEPGTVSTDLPPIQTQLPGGRKLTFTIFKLGETAVDTRFETTLRDVSAASVIATLQPNLGQVQVVAEPQGARVIATLPFAAEPFNIDRDVCVEIQGQCPLVLSGEAVLNDASAPSGYEYIPALPTAWSVE